MFVRKDSFASPRFVLSATKWGSRRLDCNVGGHLHVRFEEIETLIDRHKPGGFGEADHHTPTVAQNFLSLIPYDIHNKINFHVASQIDCDRLAPKLYELLVNHAFPFFEAYKSYVQVERTILDGPPGAVPILSRSRANAVLLAIYALQGRQTDFDRYAETAIALKRELRKKEQVPFLPLDLFERFIHDMRADIAISP